MAIDTEQYDNLGHSQLLAVASDIVARYGLSSLQPFGKMIIVVSVLLKVRR
jgi:hypothetical protein